MISKPLEAVEDLPCHDFLAATRDEPMIEEDGRAGVFQASDAHLRLPEASFEFPPMLLVRVLDIRAGLEEPLKNEILDEISGRQLRSTCIQSFEDLLCVLVDGE